MLVFHPQVFIPFLCLAYGISSGQHLQFCQWLAYKLLEFTLLKCLTGQSAWQITSAGERLMMAAGWVWINTFPPSLLAEIIPRCVFSTIFQSLSVAPYNHMFICVILRRVWPHIQNVFQHFRRLFLFIYFIYFAWTTTYFDKFNVKITL